MAKIIIPTPLRKFTEGKASFERSGETVKAVIYDLVNLYPALGTQILDANNEVRSFIRLYVGDEDVNALEGTATAVGESSVISIVPAIAGGSK